MDFVCINKKLLLPFSDNEYSYYFVLVVLVVSKYFIGKHGIISVRLLVVFRPGISSIDGFVLPVLLCISSFSSNQILHRKTWH